MTYTGDPATAWKLQSVLTRAFTLGGFGARNCGLHMSMRFVLKTFSPGATNAVWMSAITVVPGFFGFVVSVGASAKESSVSPVNILQTVPVLVPKYSSPMCISAQFIGTLCSSLQPCESDPNAYCKEKACVLCGVVTIRVCCCGTWTMFQNVSFCVARTSFAMV